MNKKKLGLAFLTILLTSTLMSSLPLASSKYKTSKGKGISITLLGTEHVPEGVKYVYEVQSGSRRHRIRRWILYSRAFKKYDVVDSSERVIQRGKKLKFPKRYRNNEKRIVWFVLKLDYEPIPPLDYITCKIKTKYTCHRNVMGPTVPWR